MERNAGLDIVRSMAILLVLFCHGLGFFFMKYHDFNPLNYVTGYFAVELFFVLSGFLIGQLLLKDVVECGSITALKNFYLRRWFRTLPLYYFAVGLTYVIFNHQMDSTNLYFLQNFDEQHLSFLPTSWSLSIEEWFYLLIPIPLLIAGKFPNKSAAFFAITSMFVFVPLILRILEVHLHQPVWDFGVRKQIPLRLDSLVFGVILAGVKTYHAAFYRKVLAGKASLLIVLAGLAYFSGYLVYTGMKHQTMDRSFFDRTFLFTFVSFFISLLIAVMETKLKRLDRLPKTWAFFRFISSQTYGYYLFHWNLFVWFSKENTSNSVGHSLYLLIFSLLLLMPFTYIMHRYYEVPFMKVRDLITKKRNTKAIMDVPFQ